MKFKYHILSNEFFIKIIESFFGRTSFIAFTLLFSLVCTQLYGAEVFGEFTIAFTLVSVVMILAKAGLDQGLMYSIPKHLYKHISLSFLVNFIVSAILIIIISIFFDDRYIIYMLPMIWFLSVEQIFFGIYRAEGRIKEFYFINGFLSMIIRIGLIIALYYFSGKNEYSIAIGVYASIIFSNIIYFIQNRSKFKKVVFDKAYLLYSFPLILATMMGTLINKVDILMLGKMVTNTDVGIYQITVQVSNVASILLAIFNIAFAPRIAKLYHEGMHNKLNELYIKSTRLLFFLSLFSSLALIVGSGLILKIFGAEFILGQDALIIRSFGQFVNVAVGGVWLMLSMTGRPKFQMYANIFAFIINMLLNFVLIPVWGINGAAFASMVTLMFINILGYIIVSKTFEVKVFKYF